MTKATVVAVVASNRERCLQDFLSAWTPAPWDETIVVEDGPGRSMAIDGVRERSIHHFSWAEIAGDADVIDPTTFSRRASAIKMYGFWAAVRLGADVVITLDDDCFPAGSPDAFVAAHLAALSPRLRWVPSIDESPTRGLPYFDHGSMAGAFANMGLWRGDADYDAPQTLALRRAGILQHSYDPPAGNRLMHPQNYWPWCAMNIAFRRELAPLMYMPKMGEGLPYHRFDDIWCGVILQRCCRHLGLSLAVGEPHIQHARASDPLINLEMEASGIRANEDFWMAIEATPLDAAKQATPLTCAEAVCAHLMSESRRDAQLVRNRTLAGYLAAEGTRMQSWCNMFRNAGWE
jgi:hypothetical protein